MYGKYAEWRTIWFDEDKSRVLMESFIIADRYLFDYEILYNEESDKLCKNGDIITPSYGEFKGKSLQLDTYFPLVSIEIAY